LATYKGSSPAESVAKEAAPDYVISNELGIRPLVQRAKLSRRFQP